LGIYHFNARFYSPKLGRFLSADTIVPNPANPQDLNRFAYVRNNPLRYTDPIGNRPCGDGEKYDCDGRLNPTTPSKPPVVIVPNPKPKKDKDPDQNPSGAPGGVVVEPPGHDYETDNIVCPAVYSCSTQEMIYYLSLYAYPGQLGPVEDGQSYTVSPFNLFPDGSYIYSGGSIIVDVTNGGLTSTNISQSTHIFHDGKVVRELSQDADGNWLVTTTGTGTNDTPVIASAIDFFNQEVGPGAFNSLGYTNGKRYCGASYTATLIPWLITYLPFMRITRKYLCSLKKRN